jgi:hypothetical protein
MTDNVSDADPQEALPTTDADEAIVPATPQVTFRANTYDLVSLGSLISGALILFTCLTCNMGYYCLPFISIILGAVGLLSLRQAVDKERTRLWSWLGIAAGGIVLLLIAACIVLYVGFIVLAAFTGEWD